MIRINIGMFKGCKAQLLPDHRKKLGSKDVPSIGVRLLELPKHKDKCTQHYKVGDMIWLCEWQYDTLPECKAPVLILNRLGEIHECTSNMSPLVCEPGMGLYAFSTETKALDWLDREGIKSGFTFECATTKRGQHAIKVTTLKQKWKLKLSEKGKAKAAQLFYDDSMSRP